MSAFADLLKLKDIEQVILAEIELRADVSDWPWSGPDVSGNYSVPWTYGEVLSVTEDGTAYGRIEYTEISLLIMSPQKSFMQSGGTLYIHPSTGKIPSDCVIMVTFLAGFTNRQRAGGEVVFRRPDNKVKDSGLDAWSSSSALREWQISVSGSSTVSRERTVVYNSESYASAKITIDGIGSEAYIYQENLILGPGKLCRVRLNYRMATGSDGAFIVIKDSGSGYYLKSDGTWQVSLNRIALPNSTEWATYELSFTTLTADETDIPSFTIQAGSATAGSVVYFDNIKVIRYRDPLFYSPLLAEDGLPDLFLGLGEYYQGDDKIQGGTLSFIENGYFAEHRDKFIWHNCPLRVRVGGIAFTDIEDYVTVVEAWTRRPAWTDKAFTLDFADERLNNLTQLCIEKFNTADWPNMDPTFVGAYYPILFGEKENIVPVRVDTKKYLVSKTTINGIVCPLDSISEVRRNGKLLTLTTDYTVDLAEGTFTLTRRAGTRKITCKAKAGIHDFEDSAVHSTNAADFVYYVLRNLNNWPNDKVNWVSLKALKTAAAYVMGEYLPGDTPSLEALGLFMRSALFRVDLDDDGRLRFPVYTAGTTGSEPHFRNEDLADFKLEESTDGCFFGVSLKYNRDLKNDNWRESNAENNPTFWRHQVREYLFVETALIPSADAAAVRDKYLAMYKDPQLKLTATLPSAALALRPADKFLVTKTISTPDYGISALLDGAVFRVLEITKNLGAMTARVTAILDSQTTGS